MTRAIPTLALALLSSGCFIDRSGTRPARVDAGGGTDSGPRVDAGRVDGGRIDAGRADAGGDAGPDARIVDMRDAGSDGGFDAGLDGGFDAGLDGGFDAGFDGGFDAGFDGGFDAGFDAGADGGFDAGGPLPSCDTTFGSVSGYHRCAERATECEFYYADIRRRTCNSICGSRGATCLGGHNNARFTWCTPAGSSSCTAGFYTAICTCTRPP